MAQKKERSKKQHKTSARHIADVQLESRDDCRFLFSDFLQNKCATNPFEPFVEAKKDEKNPRTCGDHIEAIICGCSYKFSTKKIKITADAHLELLKYIKSQENHLNPCVQWFS